MIEKAINDIMSFIGLKPADMDTIEFQELIPGIKPPAIPLVFGGLEKLPQLPGMTIRDPSGAVRAEGMRIPTMGETTKDTLGALGMMPNEDYQLYGDAHAPIYGDAYPPEDVVLDETEGYVEPLTLAGDVEPLMLDDESLEDDLDQDTVFDNDGITL
jgi:hypothetical protein